MRACASRSGATAILLLVSLAACDGGPPTTVSVRDASVDPVRGASRLTVNADVRLSEPMAEALNNGVDLVLEWELELREPGRLWGTTLAADRHALNLSYHSLSRRYLLTGLDEPRNFASLASLLAAVGRTSTLVAITPPENQGANSTWRIRARLDRSGLPPPLRLPAWVSPAWRVQSDWYEWPQTPTA